MTRIETRMPSPEGVGAGQTATFKLPIGRRYHELQMEYTGTTITLALMTEIRIIANGKIIHRYSAAQRDSLNQFDGRTASNGILIIPFDRYNLKTLAAETESALNTGSLNENADGIKTLSVEVDIASGAVAPILSMTATQSDSIPGGSGTVMHCLKHTYSVAGAGDFEISDLPRGGQTSMFLNRIFFLPSANDISHMNIMRNSYNIFDRSKTLNERMQKDGVRTPQSGYIAIDKSEKGFGGDPIDLRQITDFRYKLTMTGACTITILSEYLGRLGD